MRTEIARFVWLGSFVGLVGCGVSPDGAAGEGVTTIVSALTSAGCADGTAEQSFNGGMVGCAAPATWDNRRYLCGAGYRPATAAEWVALAGSTAPTHNYWTDDNLYFNGPGPSQCYVSLTPGLACNTGTPMRVCTSSGSDAEGNACNWTKCGMNALTPSYYFGGCDGNLTAGTLCIPEGCADGTVEQNFPNGMVGCGGAASSASAAASLCAPGYRRATADEFNTLTRPEIRVANIVKPSRNYWTQTSLVCPLFGCGIGTTGGAVCVPQHGCADGTAEQVMPDGFVGCAGAVTWASRDSLCAPGYRTATANEWSTINTLGPSITPTHNYWTADDLKFGGFNGCWVSLTSGTECNTGQPMRICTAAGTDPENNSCNWTNCGLDATAPNLHFGGCNGNATAGTLCVPSDIAPTDITYETDPSQPLMKLLTEARNQFLFPGLAVAVVVEGKIHIATIGKRDIRDATDTLQPTDKFLLDSVSKVVSGTVVTRAVDQGALSWSSTLGNTLPSLFGASMDPEYKGVTLAELDAHASGFDYDTQAHAFARTPDAANDYLSIPDIAQRKLLLTRDYLYDTNLFPHGTGWIYGTGAVPAISMLEQTTAKTPYDVLVQDYLFRPLGMAHSGTVTDVSPHDLIVAADGTTFLQSTGGPLDSTGLARLPVGGMTASIEDLARLAHAAMYSPRAPWHFWSYANQQQLQNGVGQSPISGAGWGVGVGNAAGGLFLQKDGCCNGTKANVEVDLTQRVAMVELTNYRQKKANVGDTAPALDWVASQLPSRLGSYGVPPAAFPYPEAPSLNATTPANCQTPSSGPIACADTTSQGSGAFYAFDGNYGTYWIAGAGKTSGTLQVTLPVANPVRHVVINEFGPTAAASGITTRFIDPAHPENATRVQEFRVTSWQLFLTNSANPPMETMVASGTTLGVNKMIPVKNFNGNVTKARLLIKSATASPMITEMQLLPW